MGLSKLGQFIEELSGLTGSWIRQEAFGRIIWGQILLSAVVVIVVVLAVTLLRRILGRLAHREENESARILSHGIEGISWLKVTNQALIPPLTLFLWAWGVYAALLLLLTHVQAGSEPSFLRGVIDGARDVCEIAALFWFLCRGVRLVEVELARCAANTASKWDGVFVALWMKALRIVVPLVGAITSIHALDLPDGPARIFDMLLVPVMIGAIGLTLIQLVITFEKIRLAEFRLDAKDNLEARKVHTRLKLFKTIALWIIVPCTALALLMTFESMRALGTSILASAGVLGIVVGFAAQKSIAATVAGFQIAITQPIRLGNVVLPDGIAPQITVRAKQAEVEERGTLRRTAQRKPGAYRVPLVDGPIVVRVERHLMVVLVGREECAPREDCLDGEEGAGVRVGAQVTRVIGRSQGRARAHQPGTLAEDLVDLSRKTRPGQPKSDPRVKLAIACTGIEVRANQP